MTADRSAWVRRFLAIVPIVLVIVVAAVAWRSVDGDDPPPEPVEIAASGPRFETLDALVDAADVIVEGTIVSADEGRVITDPSDPNTGFTTALFQLAVTTAFRGTTSSSLIVEQEAALLDGSPMIVNGLRPNAVGDTGFWFLIRGDDDEFPYVALVNEQGRILLDDDGRVPTPAGTRLSADDLRVALSELTG